MRDAVKAIQGRGLYIEHEHDKVLSTQRFATKCSKMPTDGTVLIGDFA